MAFATQKFGSFALGSASAAKLLRSKSQAGLEHAKLLLRKSEPPFGGGGGATGTAVPAVGGGRTRSKRMLQAPTWVLRSKTQVGAWSKKLLCYARAA